MRDMLVNAPMTDCEHGLSKSDALVFKPAPLPGGLQCTGIGLVLGTQPFAASAIPLPAWDEPD